MELTSMTDLPELEAGTYRIDSDQSTVAYSSKHMFGAGTVHAGFSIRSGEILLTEPLAGSSAHAVIDAASFTSDIPKRDRDVKSASLLDVATYPDITFASTAVRRVGDQILIDGDVTAHGSTVAVQVRVTSVESSPDGIHIHAEARHLDRYAFGISKSKGMVGRFLDLDFDVLAVHG
jgi:polyisoprenoid-binding protein YceI